MALEQLGLFGMSEFSSPKKKEKKLRLVHQHQFKKEQLKKNLSLHLPD